MKLLESWGLNDLNKVGSKNKKTDKIKQGVALVEQYWKEKQTPVNPAYKNAMLTLIENQMKALTLLEQNGVMTSQNIAPVETYILTLLARALPQQILPYFASFQPIKSTFAQVRLIKGRYMTSKGGTKEGAKAPVSFDSNVSFDPYYGSNIIEGEPIDVTLDASGGNNPTKTVTLKYGVIGGTVYLTYNGHLYSLTDGNSVTIDTSVTAEYNASTNAITFTNNDSSDHTISASAKYRTNLEGTPLNPTFAISIEKYPIEVENYRMKTSITAETFAEAAAHAVGDIGDMVMTLTADEMALEIDRMALYEIMHAVEPLYNSDWSIDASVYTEFQYRQPKPEYFRNLLLEIEKAAMAIFTRTRVAAGNVVVMNPIVAAYLESTGLLQVQKSLQERQINRVIPLGWIQEKYRVLVDPFFPMEKILVGYKGEGVENAGYIFAPYVPSVPLNTGVLKDITIDDVTFHYAIMSFFGRKMLDAGFYHVININGQLY